MNRIKIERQVFGPGERATGARFRDEVKICTGCRRVFVTKIAIGVCLWCPKDTTVLISPSAEQGPRWLAGQEVPR